MRKVFSSALLALALTVGGTASAGNLDNPYARPPVMEPQCMHLGFIPCHTLFDYSEPEGDTPLVSTPNKPTPPSDDRPRCGGPDRKDRGNASANNGKGGNYGKTGHSDNGKGRGKGRR